MRKLASILISCLALACQEAGAQNVPVWCQPIDGFIKDVESGKSASQYFDARFKLLDMTKKGPVTVRRYSLLLPQADPPEIMQLEIVDGLKLSSDLLRLLRVRPRGGNHWIEMFASAVMPDEFPPDMLPDHPIGARFRIIFDSSAGSLAVGVLFKPERQNGKAQIDQITLSVTGHHCAPDMLDK